MKCQICERFISVETSFENLFKFPMICDNCLNKYNTEIKCESLPFMGGKVDYVYLYSEIPVNAKQRDLLQEMTKKFYMLINDKSHDYALYLFIDDFNIQDFEHWFSLLKPFKRICFMSLVRYDFDGFVNFF